MGGLQTEQLPDSAYGPERVADAQSPRQRPYVLGKVLRHLAVIVVFSIPGVALFWHAWAGHLDSVATCACSDAGQQIWFMAWPATAIAHGTNPFFSSSVWAPYGVNLLANESGPLIGLLFAPATWLFGPVAADNLALTLAPALTSWACWVACRRFVSWRLAPWVGGFLFGYSPFVLSSLLQGHLTLGALVVPPLMVVALDEILRTQRRAAWTSGLGLGLLVVAQFLIDPEVLAMSALVFGAGLVVCALVAGRRWFLTRAKHAASALAVSLGVAAVLLALPAWFTLDGPRHIVGAIWPGFDLFGNNVNALWASGGGSASGAGAVFGPAGHSLANLGLGGPNPAYVGTGVLAVAALSVAVAARRKITWILLVAGSTSFVLSLGSAGLRSDALSSFSWLPWQAVVKWPLFDDVLPGRFALFTDLAFSMIIAIGLDSARALSISATEAAQARHSKSRRRAAWTATRATPPSRVVAMVACLICAVAMLVPIWRLYTVPAATETVRLPPWFSTAGKSIPAQSVVLTYPFPASSSLASEPMVWQAVDGMRFRLAGGYVKVPGAQGRPLVEGSAHSATRSLINLTLDPQTPARSWTPTPTDLVNLREALRAWEVSYVVITANGPNPTFTAAVMTAVTERAPSVSRHAWVWDLRARPVGGTFDAQVAASALGQCRSLGGFYLSAAGPLPQAANDCVANAIQADTSA